MSIELDWEVTAAPTDEDLITGDPAPDRNPENRQNRNSTSHPPKPARPPAGRGRRRWVLAGLAALIGLAGAGLWVFTQAGWQKLSSDVIAAVNYEETEATAGATNLVLNVQDRGNADWLSVRQDETLAREPAPLPAPGLRLGAAPLQVVDLNALDADYVFANVQRQFSAPDGQTLTFDLPQIYRRGLNHDWLRSAPPGAFWGKWVDWHGTQLVVRYSERDAAFVSQVAPALDQRLAQACVLWAAGCPSPKPVKLYLSDFVGALEYNPLANTEVKLDLGAPGGSALTPTDSFLSIPSPQISGIPTDPASLAYLTDYLSVRLIAAYARQASTSPEQYIRRTVQAIQALNLAQADPGYLASGQRRRSGQAGLQGRFLGDFQGSGAPPTGRVGNGQPSGRGSFNWRVVYYVTVPGDTLPSLAAHFNTAAFAIARANPSVNPEALAAGLTLTIPLMAPATMP